ncbi:MAG: DUF169 domain-containing protein [Chloroflexota bacterium]
METLKRSAQRLTEILGLERAPVAVKFIPKDEELPAGFVAQPARRYCQILMEASEGKKVLLTPDNIACPASAAALGFKPLPEKLETGEMLASFGIFASKEAGYNTIHSMPRLPMGAYRAVAACPLGEAPYEPDAVVLESKPENLMWIALAAVRQQGGRLDFSTAILQATCVDGTILPYLEQKLNASLGCYGCREATNMSEAECLLGFPGKDLERIVSQLEELETKAMPRVRGKAVYKSLVERAR